MNKLDARTGKLVLALRKSGWHHRSLEDLTRQLGRDLKKHERRAWAIARDDRTDRSMRKQRERFELAAKSTRARLPGALVDHREDRVTSRERYREKHAPVATVLPSTSTEKDRYTIEAYLYRTKSPTG